MWVCSGWDAVFTRANCTDHLLLGPLDLFCSTIQHLRTNKPASQSIWELSFFLVKYGVCYTAVDSCSICEDNVRKGELLRSFVSNQHP